MLIRHLLLQYSPTTKSSKLPCPVVKPTNSLLASVHWLPIRQRVTYKLADLVYRSLHETSPTYLSYTATWSLRSSSAHLLVEPRLRTTLASRGFRFAGLRIWNSLPNHIKLVPSFSSFRSRLKTYLFSSSSTFRASDSTYTRFCARYKCFTYITL